MSTKPEPVPEAKKAPRIPADSVERCITAARSERDAADEVFVAAARLEQAKASRILECRLALRAAGLPIGKGWDVDVDAEAGDVRLVTPEENQMRELAAQQQGGQRA